MSVASMLSIVAQGRTDFTYDAYGNPVTITETLGDTSTAYYDAAGSVTQITDFRGYSTKAGYDVHEFLINATDASGNMTTHQNDAIGRRWNTTTPLGGVSKNEYDADSRVTTSVDPMGNSTTFAFGVTTESRRRWEKGTAASHDQVIVNARNLPLARWTTPRSRPG